MNAATYERIKADIDCAADDGRMDQLEHLAGHCVVLAAKTGAVDEDYLKYKELWERAAAHAKKIYDDRTALLRRYSSQVDLDYLQAHPGLCQTVRCYNQAGCLWEKLYMYEDGKFKSKVCASGVFVDWVVHETREATENELLDTLNTIERVRAEERGSKS